MLANTPFVILDDARPGGAGMRVFREPAAVFSASSPDEVAPALENLDLAAARGLHAAGYFAYELGYFLEPRLVPLAPSARSLPLLWFGLFGQCEEIEAEDVSAFLERNTSGRAYAGPLNYLETAASYGEKFGRAREYIRAGDIYQVNLTFPARFSFLGDPLALYARLRGAASAGHGAYVFDGARSILSLSPELFFSVRNGAIAARPMKGTAPRGQDEAADANLRNGLAASEKNRAENLMIVDLIRNDLGRVARTGSVAVRDLFAVETYPTLHQMVSTVTAGLADGTRPSDLIRAAFPCGSVTGAPKIRAMEIVRELESVPRGVYCGAIGAFAPGGDADFNVAIRTLTISGNAGSLGIGSAIVADSDAGSEYGECILKARFYAEGRPPIALIETLRHEPDSGFLRVGHHLDRLGAAAARLGIVFDAGTTLRAMENAVKDFTGPARLRLQLEEDGTCRIAAEAFVPPGPDTVWKFAYSPHRIASADLIARHKTSWRALFDAERARARQNGIDEIVYLNRQGEIAEASSANVFAEIGGSLVTPPLAAGALDGCLRRSLLEAGRCAERVLTPDDLATADCIYLGNSLRGLVRAVPAPAP